MQVVTNCTTKQNVKYIAKANAKNFQNISNLILKRARRVYRLTPRYYQNGKSSSADVAGGTYAGELCTGVTGAC